MTAPEPRDTPRGPTATQLHRRAADEDRAGGRNTLTRFADADLCTPGAACEGHPAGPFDPMGQTVYCDGSCQDGAA